MNNQQVVQEVLGRLADSRGQLASRVRERWSAEIVEVILDAEQLIRALSAREAAQAREGAGS